MVDYHDRYVRLNQHLNDHVHPKVNAGAAATDDLWLTDHGPEHVATVISRINDLTFRDGNFVVSPYEAYLLLVSAHFHDVGNVFGRENHEKHLRDVLFTLPPEYTGDDNIEKRTICDIAMAHGGKVLSLSGGLPTKDTKDTIGHMSHDRNVKKLAAILRFADELADDRTRTNYLDGMVMQRNTDLREKSEVFHVYASRLHPPVLDHNSRSVRLHFELATEHLKRQYKKSEADVFLLDEIFDRTLKVHREQVYCLRFMSPEVVLDQVDVVVSVCSDNFSIVKAQLHYLLEQGYPHYIDKFDQVSDPAIALNGSTIRDRIDDLLGQYAGDVIDLNAAANT